MSWLFVLVEAAGEVGLRAFAQEDEADGGQRQADEHADKAHELPEGHQGENHPEGGEADAVADDFGGDEEAFEKLSHGKHRPDGNHAVPGVELQQGGDGGEQQAGERAQIGDEHEDAGNHADGETGIEAGKHEAGAVDQPHNQHHHKLPAQEFAQYVVHFAADAGVGVDEAARNQGADAVRPALPVEQEIVKQQRQQDEVTHAHGQRAALRHEGGGDLRGGLLHRAAVVFQPVGGGFFVQRQAAAEMGVQPGQGFVLGEVDKLRQAVGEVFKLGDQHGHEDQQQGEQQQQGEHHHQHRGRAARHAFVA